MFIYNYVKSKHASLIKYVIVPRIYSDRVLEEKKKNLTQQEKKGKKKRGCGFQVKRKEKREKIEKK